MYSVNYTNSAKKDLMKLPSDVQEKIRYAIEELQENPRHRGVEKLTTSSKSQEYRIRGGDYRVKFLIHDDILMIFVIKIAHRKNVYN
ncbi:MAG: type II toxin-antitoxin system RelE family toxin [Methanosarcina sp.]